MHPQSAIRRSSILGACGIVFIAFLALEDVAASAQSATPTSATSTSSSVSISQQHNQPEVVSHETTTFKVRVNQVLLRVVVRDSHGNAVGNLSRDAFQVLDNGKPQPITSFSLTGSGAGQFSTGKKPEPEESAKVDAPQRYVAYVFDDLHVEVPDLVRVKEAASKYLTASMTPTDRAAIFTTSGRVMLDFTDNRKQLLEAIAKIQQALLMRAVSSDCPRMTAYFADQIVNKNNRELKQALVSDTVECLNLQTGSPALDAAAIATAAPLVENAAERELNNGDADMRMSLSVIRDILGRLSTTPGQRSMVLVSPGFFITDYSLMTLLFDRALHADIAINALDVCGLWTDPVLYPQKKLDKPGTQPLFERYMHESASHQNDVLAEIADGTGGVFFRNNNDLLEGFRRTSANPEFAYMLSFTPQSLKADGKFHNLKVVINNPPGLTARTQKGYFAPSRTQDAAEQTKSDIEDAVFSRDERQDIPVDLHTEFFKSATDQANVAVLTHVDLRHLTFRKEADRNLDTITVVSVLFDRNGRFVSGQEKTIEFHMRDDSMQRHLQNGIAIKSSFAVKPGDYLVRVVVRDTEGQLLSARNDTLTIP